MTAATAGTASATARATTSRAAARAASARSARARARARAAARVSRAASRPVRRTTTTTRPAAAGSRRGRYRDRRGRRGRDDFQAGEPQVADDDVLIPVAGILDILDNYAFIRTSGYLPGPNDVYVSLAQVRKNGLRKGDHVTGAVRQPKEGERREKFNALVRLDSANGMAADSGRGRPEFNKLTRSTRRTGSAWRPTRAC